MPIYKVGDRKYDIPQEELEGFLAEFPQAEEFIEGKTTPTDQDMSVDATEVSEVTESTSEDGSLELEETKYKTPLTLEEKKSLQNNQFSKQMSKEDNFTKERLEELQSEDEVNILESLAARTARGFVGAGKGISQTKDMLMLGLMSFNNDFTPEEKIIAKELLESGNIGSPSGFLTLPSTDSFKELEEILSESVRKTDNESITQAISSGDYSEAAELTVGGALESMPSLLAAFTGYGGIAMLGASVAGNKFDEELRNNPEEAISSLTLNAIGSGAIESGFEIVTRGLLTKAGFIKNTQSVEAAKDFIKKGSESLVKKLGLSTLGEGLSEGFTELTSIAFDNIQLGKETSTGEMSSRFFDAFIIGGFVGGNITSVSEIGGASTAARNRAEYILTPQEIQKKYQGSAAQLSELSKSLKNANTPESKKVILEQMEAIEQQIVRAKGEVSRSLNELTPEELIEYASNQEQILEKTNVVKDQTDENIIKTAKDQIEGLNQANIDLFGIAAQRILDKDIAFTESEAGKYGLEVEVFENPEDFGNAEGVGVENINADGVVVGNKVLINKDRASKVGAVSVGSHELLHGILKNAISSGQAGVEIIDNFKTQLNSSQKKAVEARLKAKDSNGDRLYSDEYLAKNPDEYLTAFSDAIQKKEISFEENIFTKIGDLITPLLRKIGFSKIKFNTGKDVYDFMREYNKSITQGALSKDIVEATSGEVVFEEIVKSNTNEQASNEVQELYDTQGEAAAFDIIEQFKPITSKIVEKRSQAPGFDRQLLTDEIETGKRGILDLIKEYNPESGVPLAAYINKFLPARAIEASRRILGEEFTDDVTEAKGVAAEEVSVDVTPTDKSTTSKLRRVLGIKQGDAIYDLAKEVSGEILSGDLPGKKVKTAINKEARKSKLRKAVSDLMGTEKAIDEQFLNKNILEILKALPASDLVKLEREAKVKVLAEQGPRLNVKDAREAVNKGLLPKDTNLQSGPKVSSKLPTTLEQAKEFFIQKRKAGLVNVVTEMLVKDAAPEVTKDKMEPAKRAKVLSEIDRAPTLKFSLSTKQDIAFEENENEDTGHVTFEGEFEVGDTQFALKLIPLDNISDDFEAEFELKKQLEAKNIDTKELLSIEFEDFEDGLDVTGKSLEGKTSAIKTFSIVANSVLDFVKENNIKGVVFNSAEANRTRLYKAMVDRFSKELGWEYKQVKTTPVQGEVDTFVITPKETTKEQPTVKFSKSNLTKEQLNLVKQEQGEIFQRFVSSDRSVKSMRLILSDVLEDAGASDETISKYAKELTSPAKKFIVDLEKQLVTESDFGEVTNEQIEQALSAITLKALLNIFVNPGGAFDVTEYLNKFRKLQHEYQLEQIKKLGSLDGIISILKFHKDYHTSAGKIGDGRYQGYAGSLDWFKATNEALKDKKIEIEYRKTGTGVVPVNILINNVEQFKNQAELKAKIKTFSQSNNLKRETVEAEYGARKEEAGEGFDAMVDYLGFISSKGDKLQFGMSLMALKSNMSALGKRVAYVKYFYNGKSDSATVFEHMLPSLYTLKEMVKNFYEGGVDLEALKESQQVAMIPRDMDKRINIVHQASMPSWFKLGMSPLTRYFNALTKGYKNMFALESIGGKDKGVVYGEDHLALNNSVLKASKSNNNILPNELKLKGDFINDNVLNEMSDIDNDSQAEEQKFSKSLDLNKDFNDIIENKTGIASDKTYARVKAEVAGANKGKFNFFIPPSAEDFVGLLYSTLGKGSTGDAQMAWYKAHLLNPFARAMENLANDRANMMQDFRGLKKALKIVPKNLRKKIKDSNFTQEQAVRAYIWDKQGMEIPGLSNKDQKDLVNFVNADANLTTFANQLIAINKGDEYAAPDAGWVAGTIGTDFIKALNTTKRSKYLEVWQQNVDQIFSEANLNKLEAAYGANYKEAMVDMLKRMETGRNTSSGSDRLAGRFTDWLTNSVGAIMFFNTRSAVLQTISAVNFINFSDNNVLKAGQAFANQPQYWKDFKKLFNSPFLLDRRSGLKLNVNEADIADMAKGPGNSARNVIAGILKAGFLPTQLADSFAIASGGASFYRNRIKALQKEGLTEAEAEEVAFRDFREIAEESQQSSRPDKISQQQAGPLGRVVLAFANTPAQYARLIKKAASDLKNGRGDAKTNISKIIYYGVAQNILFSALQQALFAISFGDEEEEEEKRNEKYFNIANGMSDSILRGIGVGGAIASVVKNTAIKLVKEEKKKSPKYQDVLVKEVLQISPPISSKVGKLRSAGRSVSWNKKEMMTKGWAIDNPAYLASANVISAITNVPADRAIKKITNIVDASNEETEYYKRIALALGWSSWELGIDKKDKKKPESSTGKSRTRKRSRTRKKRN